MTPASNSLAGFREGVNDPSPITRVIAIDWHDGPVEGFLQIGQTGQEFRFKLIDIRSGAPDDDDVRVYALHPLPASAFDRVVSSLAATHEPHWPLWWPVWQFPSEDARRAAEAVIDQVTASAGPLTWVLVGDIGLGPVRALPVLARAS